MKKLFVLMALAGMIALTSCGGSGTQDNSSNAGEKMDSMVNEATSAVGNAADSVAQGAKNAADSVKAAADSAVNGDHK